MQFCIVTYVLVNEFIHKSLLGIFLMLAFSHYINFLTFTLVVDSCQTEELDAKRTKSRVFNSCFRLLMRVSQIAFILIAMFGPA